MTLRRHFSVQLVSALTGAAILTAGGVCLVTKNALPTKHTIYSDKDGTSATNPVALTRGKLDFWVNDADLANKMVDLYIQTPDDRFEVVRNILPSGPNEVIIGNRPQQVMVIPFDSADYVAATETDTGFNEPAANTANFTADSGSAILRVTALHAAKTIDVGTAEVTPNESGDANGFMSAVSLATLALLQDTSTIGALLTTLVGHISGGKSITITLSASTTTAQGYIYLPYTLFN